MASDDLYRQYLVELYRHPHNFGRLEAPDVRQEGHNPLCGDQVTIDLALTDDTVREARFDGQGCAVSIAAASLLTDLVPGKTADEVLALTDLDMVAEMGLDGLTPARLKCAILALKTMQAGLDGHRGGAEARPAMRTVTTEEG